jgi:hypothetical protein
VSFGDTICGSSAAHSLVSAQDNPNHIKRLSKESFKRIGTGIVKGVRTVWLLKL